MTQDKDIAVNKAQRGFARLDPERQRAISSAGGRAAQASGNAHQFTSAEARAAGRKGGQARRKTAAAPTSN